MLSAARAPALAATLTGTAASVHRRAAACAAPAGVRAGGGGGSGAPRAQAGQVVGKGPGMQCIYSVTPRRFPDPFDLPGQTFLLLFPCVYWKGCVWCSVPFSSVHGTARGSRCSRNLFWRKTCSEHREKMGKLAVLINICKQNLFLMFDMRAV